MPQKADPAPLKIDSCGALEQLHQHIVAVHFENLASSEFTVLQLYFSQLIVSDTFNTSY